MTSEAIQIGYPYVISAAVPCSVRSIATGSQQAQPAYADHHKVLKTNHWCLKRNITHRLFYEACEPRSAPRQKSKIATFLSQLDLETYTHCRVLCGVRLSREDNYDGDF